MATLGRIFPKNLRRICLETRICLLSPDPILRNLKVTKKEYYHITFCLVVGTGTSNSVGWQNTLWNFHSNRVPPPPHLYLRPAPISRHFFIPPPLHHTHIAPKYCSYGCRSSRTIKSRAKSAAGRSSQTVSTHALVQIARGRDRSFFACVFQKTEIAFFSERTSCKSKWSE